jgi:hypothetical protein
MADVARPSVSLNQMHKGAIKRHDRPLSQGGHVRLENDV